MTGWWTVSYVALWIAVVILAALLLGTMREVALLRRGGIATQRRQRNDPNGPELGTPIPDITVPAANGFGRIALREPGGGPVLLTFLTPTCEGCQLAVESLNRLVASEGDRLDVRVVLSGPETAARSFLKLFPVLAPVVLDQNHALSGDFGIHITPSGLLYDENGLLVRSGTISEPEELAALMAGGNGNAPAVVDGIDDIRPW